MSAHVMTLQESIKVKKKYFNVFWGLCVLTAVELLIVQCAKWFPSVPKLLIDTGIVLFSGGKAVVVGYYYMHLEHETKWMKYLALLPVIAFMYAFFLVLDVKRDRHMSIYWNEPAREYPAEMMDRAKHSSHSPHNDASDMHAHESMDAHAGHDHAHGAASTETLEINVKSGQTFKTLQDNKATGEKSEAVDSGEHK